MEKLHTLSSSHWITLPGIINLPILSKLVDYVSGPDSVEDTNIQMIRGRTTDRLYTSNSFTVSEKEHDWTPDKLIELLPEDIAVEIMVYIKDQDENMNTFCCMAKMHRSPDRATER